MNGSSGVAVGGEALNTTIDTDEPYKSYHKVIALVGCLDTKGVEYLFVKNLIEKWSAFPSVSSSSATVSLFRTLVIDVGVLDEPHFEPDVKRSEVCLELSLHQVCCVVI